MPNANEYGMPLAGAEMQTQLASITPQHTSLMGYLTTAMGLPMDAAALLATKLLPTQPVRTPMPASLQSGDPRNTDQYIPPRSHDSIHQAQPPWMQAGFENVKQYDAWLHSKGTGANKNPGTGEGPGGDLWNAAQFNRLGRGNDPQPNHFQLRTPGQASTEY